jgi:cellulose biosynthesis protein BcsQ
MTFRYNEALSEVACWADITDQWYEDQSNYSKLSQLFEPATQQGNGPKTIFAREQDVDVRIIRDVYGRLRYAINCNSDEYPAGNRVALELILAGLDNYATKDSILFRDDMGNPDLIFNSPEWHITIIPGNFDSDGQPTTFWAVNMLDRQIIGQDWLNESKRKLGEKPHRIVFYGLKGGVGRSTALAMTAYGLAKAGKRVLVLDFDLESPGLGSLLLPATHAAKFGLIDWFVEDAVGQADDDLLDNMVANSTLDVGTGKIQVVAALGSQETAYLSKLTRVYVDVPAREAIYADLPDEEKGKGSQRFASRMQRVISTLEQRFQPDVVLIDSRAGLHDIAGIAITTLADTALLFVTGSAQNWMGYRQLFNHWQHRPVIKQRVRTRLAMVQALAPQNDKEYRAAEFQQHAYQLFADTLYDGETNDVAEAENLGITTASTTYRPQMDDQTAPHFPIRVEWSALFQEFDPLRREADGGASHAQIAAAFGALQSWVLNRITQNDE